MTLLDCGHPPTPTNSNLNTGVCHLPNDSTCCYNCAAGNIREELRTADYGAGPVVYVSSDGMRVTTWDGQELGRIVQWGSRHPWSEDRRYFNAVVEGRLWSGTGAPNMYAPLRRIRVR